MVLGRYILDIKPLSDAMVEHRGNNTTDISYGSMLWRSKTQQQSSKRLLSRIKRLVNLSVPKTVRTTQTDTLEMILVLPPLHTGEKKNHNVQNYAEIPLNPNYMKRNIKDWKKTQFSSYHRYTKWRTQVSISKKVYFKFFNFGGLKEKSPGKGRIIMVYRCLNKRFKRQYI